MADTHRLSMAFEICRTYLRHHTLYRRMATSWVSQYKDRRCTAKYCECRTTHSEMVVPLGDRAYKLKKPVDLRFSTSRPGGAASVCRREVELNRWLARDAYLGASSR